MGNTNNENMNEKFKAYTQEEVMKILNFCYRKCLDGIPRVSKSVESMANDYLKGVKSTERAARDMIRSQVMKCATSGFLTGFGGVLTMPVTVPANISSVLYVQMRMIACLAYMAGFDMESDQTQTFIYACLAGIGVNELIKKAGIEVGKKVTTAALKRLPGQVITKINQKVGFRLVTKFGEKGVINIGKMIPVVGAVVGGGFDLVETRIIANRAYKWFIKGNMGDADKDTIIETVDAVDFADVSIDEEN